jgi:hypothetical protein
MEAPHESISRGVVDSRLQELNATQPGHGLEKLRFKLTALVGGDGLRTTEAGYPAGEAVDCSETVFAARRRRKGSHKVYMNV